MLSALGPSSEFRISEQALINIQGLLVYHTGIIPAMPGVEECITVINTTLVHSWSKYGKQTAKSDRDIRMYLSWIQSSIPHKTSSFGEVTLRHVNETCFLLGSAKKLRQK